MSRRKSKTNVTDCWIEELQRFEVAKAAAAPARKT
jgi:hypothetical protein